MKKLDRFAKLESGRPEREDAGRPKPGPRKRFETLENMPAVGAPAPAVPESSRARFQPPTADPNVAVCPMCAARVEAGNARCVCGFALQSGGRVHESFWQTPPPPEPEPPPGPPVASTVPAWRGEPSPPDIAAQAGGVAASTGAAIPPELEAALERMEEQRRQTRQLYLLSMLGPRLLGVFLTIAVLFVALAFGVFGRGCRAVTGELP